jgi:NAD-dependent deacetylase
MIEYAAEICYGADIMIVVGTSLQVYPAAGLIDMSPSTASKYIVDVAPVSNREEIETISEPASNGVPKLVQRLLD